MLDPHKQKFFKLYWETAYAAARQSQATRRKVGAVVVTPSGMLSVGWNGTPPGFPNECEERLNHEAPSHSSQELITKPEVIHAERNAIDKMTRQGVSTKGSILFVTTAPCFECAKSLIGLGLSAIYYAEVYRSGSGLDLLRRAEVPVYQAYSLDLPIPF